MQFKTKQCHTQKHTVCAYTAPGAGDWAHSSRGDLSQGATARFNASISTHPWQTKPRRRVDMQLKIRLATKKQVRTKENKHLETKESSTILWSQHRHSHTARNERLLWWHSIETTYHLRESRHYIPLWITPSHMRHTAKRGNTVSSPNCATGSFTINLFLLQDFERGLTLVGAPAVPLLLPHRSLLTRASITRFRATSRTLWQWKHLLQLLLAPQNHSTEQPQPAAPWKSAESSSSPATALTWAGSPVAPLYAPNGSL